MRQWAGLLDMDVDLVEWRGGPLAAGAMNIFPVPLREPVTPGRPATDNAGYVLQTLSHALDACREGRCAAMVTGPVSKSVIIESGVPFSGHTEWLAERTGARRVVMMLAGAGLRVALATTHLPLGSVSRAISKPLLLATLQIMHDDLRSGFGIREPRILVCGLNPHAGESGHLGREEIDIIAPAIREAVAAGIRAVGPLPADTVFTARRLAEADAVLAMYHDQGLPVLKHAAFGRAVNITLGLPLIRTSVDHGVAFDLAGSGQADCGSMQAAIECAADLAASSSHEDAGR